MDSLVKDNYERWLASSTVSEEEKKEILSYSDEERDDAFFQDIKFETAGMRGKLGPGTNRINFHTIGRATIALGLFLRKAYPNELHRGVVISHDNRFFSREFALDTARILNEEGIDCYLFDSLRPTPELSFAVRKMKALAGVMITASHNTKEYNGYKVYDDTGCQLTPTTIVPFLKEFNALPNELDAIPFKADKTGSTSILPPSIDDEYIALVKTCQVHPELNKKGFKVVYSPQHGTSYENAMRVFEDLGYDVHPVLSQCVHDPAFGATLSPNPETAESFIESLKLAEEIKADLCVMTDPDGDRCGLAYLSSKGTYERLTGNESGALLLDYLLSSRKELGLLPTDGTIYDTIVTSDLGRKVAKYYGVKVESFLTGFKYIGARIDYYEKLGHGPSFQFGYEESYGCLIKPFVRDKDGIQAILMYTEMALYYHNKGIALDEAYENLEKRLGFHTSETRSIFFEGSAGAEALKKLMNGLHEHPFTEILGLKAARIEDYWKQEALNLADGSKEVLTLDKSNAVKIIFEDTSWIAIRPSGTEPKCKFYVEVVQLDPEGIDDKVAALHKELRKILHLG